MEQEPREVMLEQLDSLSLARGISDTVSVLCWPVDLNGIPRPVHGADAGCYQFVPY